jgi:hypothetical protein
VILHVIAVLEFIRNTDVHSNVVYCVRLLPLENVRMFLGEGRGGWSRALCSASFMVNRDYLPVGEK